MSNFINIRPVGVELFHADGRTDGETDMTKLTVAFRSIFIAFLGNLMPVMLYVRS